MKRGGQVAVCLSLVLGCGATKLHDLQDLSQPAPPSDQRDREPPVLGAIVEGVWVDAQNQPFPFFGELIAVQPRRLVMLDQGEPQRLFAVPLRDVTQLTILDAVVWSAAGAGPATLGGLALSVILNGVMVGISGPAWMVSGVVSATVQSHRTDADATGAKAAALRAYARFPGGMPLAWAQRYAP